MGGRGRGDGREGEWGDGVKKYKFTVISVIKLCNWPAVLPFYLVV